MKHRTRMSLVALIASASLTSTVAASAPAHAAPPPNCPFVNSLCLFDRTGFGGERFTAAAFAPGGICVNLASHGWGARARSGINTHGQAARLYTSTDCTGVFASVFGNSSLPTLPTTTANSVFVASLF